MGTVYSNNCFFSVDTSDAQQFPTSRSSSASASYTHANYENCYRVFKHVDLDGPPKRFKADELKVAVLSDCCRVNNREVYTDKLEALESARYFSDNSNFEGAFLAYLSVLELYHDHVSISDKFDLLQQTHSASTPAMETPLLLSNMHTNTKSMNQETDKNKTYAAVYDELAQLCFGNGRTDAALLFYESATWLDSINPGYWYRRGVVYQSILDAENATGCFSRCLKLDPDYPPALFNLGIINKNLNRYDEAIRLFTILINNDPHNTEVLLLIAECHGQQCDIQKAIQCIDRVLHLDPSYKAAEQYASQLRTIHHLSADGSSRGREEKIKSEGECLFRRKELTGASIEMPHMSI